MAKRDIKHYFSHNPTVNTNRTMFDMSYVNTTTINPDYMYPVYHQLILPGDSVVFSYSNFIRMLDPLQVPMMDNLYADLLLFFVPFDNVWDYTEEFFGQPRRPSDPVISTLPTIDFTSSTLPQSGSVYDYFDIPIVGNDYASSGTTPNSPLLTGGFSIQAMPLLAYYAIHDDWIMDEQRGSYLLDTPDFTAQTFSPDKFQLYKRGKRFDYLTSTLLNPQVATPTSLSIGTSAPVYGDGTTLLWQANANASNPNSVYGSRWVVSSGSHFNTLGILADGGQSSNQVGDVTSTASPVPRTNTFSGIAEKSQLDQLGFDSAGIYADLSSATAVSVESLRRAFQVQAYNELLARYGQRYPEYIYSMYGVVSDDLLLRRCEFLGSTHQRLSVQPIVQNSASQTNAPLGDLGAIVSGGTDDDVFTRSFTKFGYIIGLLNIYSDLTYYQGLQKEWSLLDPMDFPLNIFANLTDTPVYKKEIVLTGTSTDDDVFGYSEIYAWAKSRQNTLSGLCRPNAPQTIGYWSLAQQFASVPVNDNDFIQSNTPIERITSVSSGSNAIHFIVNQKFDVKITRELPMHSNPMHWMNRG